MAAFQKKKRKKNTGTESFSTTFFLGLTICMGERNNNFRGLLFVLSQNLPRSFPSFIIFCLCLFLYCYLLHVVFSLNFHMEWMPLWLYVKQLDCQWQFLLVLEDVNAGDFSINFDSSFGFWARTSWNCENPWVFRPVNEYFARRRSITRAKRVFHK